LLLLLLLLLSLINFKKIAITIEEKPRYVALEQLLGGWAHPLRPRGTWAPAWSTHVALESYLSAEHTWRWGFLLGSWAQCCTHVALGLHWA